MNPKIPRRAIAILTAQAFDTTLEVLATSSRNPRHCKARWAIWHLVKQMVPISSLSVLGDLIGNRDHTTVMHGLARATDLLETDADFVSRIERARRLIAAWRPGSLPARERVVPLVPLAPKRETPPAVNSEAPKLISQFGDYETWLRHTCDESQAAFLELAKREFPHLVRFPQREAAE